ncbi:MAG: hypothetical protein CMC78_02245 [Flavobacteriaceae bacterium]|nr:hypothetical protein [Flavobacteriaceae bacterium]|tara:strand:- start:1007 stop:1849 length:843 start_codon:yes stop_codon:yes gene_type:complete
MATIASPSETSLYLNAFDKTIQYDGVMKTIDDDYWTSDIVPILYPMWDSDKDKLELFVQYKDGTSKMNKTKYQRNQKTGAFKWVSYQFDLSPFSDEITDMYTRVIEKWTEYRVGQENDLERALAASFSRTAIINWTKVTLIRNFLLMDSDWTQLGDAQLTTDQKAQWVTYRQKLRDIPADQKSIPANSVIFPVTPTKYAKMADSLDYLSDVTHFYTIPQSVYSKFSTRIVNYLALAIGTIDIDEMPVVRISRPNSSIEPNTGDNTLDDILKMIDEGDFGE